MTDMMNTLLQAADGEDANPVVSLLRKSIESITKRSRSVSPARDHDAKQLSQVDSMRKLFEDLREDGVEDLDR